MLYRTLGRSGIVTSVIGLGVEHLKGLDINLISSIVKTSLMYNINFIDMVWALPEITSGIAEVTKDKDVKFQIHLGSGVIDGKYVCSRKSEECENYFNNTLMDLKRKNIDIVNLHYIKNVKTWKEVIKNGLLDLSLDLKDNKKAKAVGISTHSSEVVKLAVESGEIDVITYQINLANHNMSGRDEALEICRDYNIGVIAMKPFAGGKLLQYGKKVRVAAYQTGGRSQTFKIPLNATPLKCLSYVLDQPGVSATIAGFSSINEVLSSIQYFNVTKEDLDYSNLLENLYT
ncbi:aldo/keto reductase [Candidatus Bathyarchaeota archaeon]|nr:aldo/keto reductase [Candidatus Bathyarchaeota archaeon]